MASRFWVGGTGTWDGVTTTHWAATSGGAGGQTVPGISDTVTFDANSGAGTVTVATNVAVQSIDISGWNAASTLDFATNNNSVTLTGSGATGFSDSGSNTHTVNMGSNTWTISAGASAFTALHLGNSSLTLNANTSTLVLNTQSSALCPIIRGGSKTLNIVQFSGTSAQWYLATTFNASTMTIAAGNDIILAGSITLTNAPTWTGTRAAPIMLTLDTPFSSPAISCATGTATLTWGILCGVQASGGATFNAANSLSYGNTTGWTIQSGPSAGAAGGIIYG